MTNQKGRRVMACGRFGRPNIAHQMLSNETKMAIPFELFCVWHDLVVSADCPLRHLRMISSTAGGRKVEKEKGI
ncbi:Uncharacterized protein APZ42_017433 [Daphnia magna]|uniref:Uncharacterized protein n=1 Tax=Daphnia magna TaxID=35525 RepID=A0A164ZVB6_9CRUS|nr:Uncharacterized protein APZ42_017433 [Daphnia magna]